MHRKAVIHFNPGQPVYIGINTAFVGKDYRVVAKGHDGSVRIAGVHGFDGKDGNSVEVNIHFVTLGSLTIDARGGNGDKGHDGVTEERASKTLSDGDGTYKSIAPVRAATAGGAGGNRRQRRQHYLNLQHSGFYSYI
jgi:hypothetical protein